MVSNNPFSYTGSYTDLLNQTGTPQTPLFCTQTPLFSNQTPETGTPQTPDDVDPVDESSAGSNREARRRWTVPEDGALVSAWLNTSKDSIVGNEQRVGAFWKRVTAYYSACSAVKHLAPREWNTCKQRWAKINEGVQKFCGCYEQAGRQATSGQSEDDVFEMAYKFYYQDQKSNFTLEHVWRMLRNDQKWCSLSKDKGKSNGKRVQRDTAGAGSTMEEQVEERPIGVKAAKAAKLKGNTNVSRTNEDREASLKNLQTVAALRKEDFANKDKLANKKLLASLLVKTEPLTEIENELKNKLISQIL